MEAQEITNPSMRDFLYLIFKRKAQILIFFGVTAFTVTIGTLLWPPTYETTSQILVKIGRENLFVPASGVNPVVNINREQQINSEIEILKSRSLAEQVVESLGPRTIYPKLKIKENDVRGSIKESDTRKILVEKAAMRLQKHLDIKAIKKSNVIEIGFRHRNRGMTAIVVNTIVKFFLDRHLDIHKNRQSYKFFKDQSETLKERLRQGEETIKAFKGKHAVTSLEQELSLLLTLEANLSGELNQSLAQKAATNNRIKEIRRQLAATPKTISQGKEINSNPYLINTLETKLVELELKRRELLSKYTPRNRLVQDVIIEIQIVRDKLEKQNKKGYRKSLFGPNPTYQRLQEELLQNETNFQALNAKTIAQSGQIEEYREKLDKLNRIEMELHQLQSQLDVYRQNYRLYLTKFEESRISNAMDAEKIANVSVIEPALPPLKPVSPNTLLNMVLGIIFGSFGGIFLAFLLEFLDDSMGRPEDVERYLRLPVLASIP
ncbi:MAG: GumC family protein [Desulfobacteraceae bacterium]|nr:GumC family protein [Desulfobacteraceae bacterium]